MSKAKKKCATNKKQESVSGDLKKLEPIGFDPFAILKNLIDERCAEEELFMGIPKEKRSFVKEGDALSPEDIFSGTIKEALSKQAQKLDEFLCYLEEAKGLLEKKHGNQESTIELAETLVNMDEEFCSISAPDEKADADERFALTLNPPFSHYIETKYETLRQLYQMGLNRCRKIDPETVQLDNIQLAREKDRGTLELLQRRFEKGSEQYPLVRHSVMTWPFMRLTPRPPKDKVTETIKKGRTSRHQYLSLQLMPTAFATSHTMAIEWVDGPVESLKGASRFTHLAQEAGKILWESLSEETIQCPKPLLEGQYKSFWLYAVHYLRKTHIMSDGWDGLFDEDSDFDEDSWRKGFYTFRESEDVFLDSVFVCDLLLNNGDAEAENKMRNLEPLPEMPQKILDILKELPPGKALIGRKIADKLQEIYGITTDENTLCRHHFPKLKPHGLKNKARVGYYLDPHPQNK